MNKKAVIFGIKGIELTKDESNLIIISKPWGIIFFSRYIKNLPQLKKLISQIKFLVNNKNYPILIDQEGGVVSRLNDIIDFSPFSQNYFGELYKKSWLEMMRKKIGLFGEDVNDEALIDNLLLWMNQNKADYTNTFCSLMKDDVKKNKIFQKSTFIDWYKRWKDRLLLNKKPWEFSLNLMSANNPLIIPRNHKVEESLEAAYKNADLKPMLNLLEVLKNPYENKSGISDYQLPANLNGKIYKTFCGT